jgi:hypothetical protein
VPLGGCTVEFKSNAALSIDFNVIGGPVLLYKFLEIVYLYTESFATRFGVMFT